MSNKHPNTKGLRPFNKMPRSESREIQSAGGKTSAQKRYYIKTMKEIIFDVRKTSDIDPVEAGLQDLFARLNSPVSTVNEKVKVFDLIYKLTGEKPEDYSPDSPSAFL